jgi:hypothetical protein
MARECRQRNKGYNVEEASAMRHPLRTTAFLSLLAYAGGLVALLMQRHGRTVS